MIWCVKEDEIATTAQGGKAGRFPYRINFIATSISVTDMLLFQMRLHI